MIGAAIEGYLFTTIPLLIRVLAAAGAFCLIDSGIYADIVGGAVLVIMLAVQRARVKRENAARN
jgi:TRAP-type uncharacterized transport system fused permease subunit